MSLVSRLIDLVSEAIEGPAAASDTPPDGKVAVAALLVHVARVDGIIAPSERTRVAALLRDRFSLSEEAAERLISRADRLDREVDDVADLIDMLGHAVPDADRRQLVAMAYAVAGADGHIEEFEDDLVWRLARLLGFTESITQSIRSEALAGGGAARE